MFSLSGGGVTQGGVTGEEVIGGEILGKHNISTAYAMSLFGYAIPAFCFDFRRSKSATLELVSNLPGGDWLEQSTNPIAGLAGWGPKGKADWHGQS